MLTTIEWHTLVGKALSPGSAIVDLGANTGRFARKMRQRFDAEIFALEPNPHLLDAINPSGDPRIHLRPWAATGNPVDDLSFQIDSTNPLASRIDAPAADGAERIRVRGVSLPEILDWTARPFVDLVKVDVEGAEVDLLLKSDGETLARIGQLTIEFHDFCGLITAEQVRQVKRHLNSAGFYGVNMSRIGHQDTIFLNRSFFPLGFADRMRLHAYKYRFGAARLLAKLRHGAKWYEKFD